MQSEQAVAEKSSTVKNRAEQREAFVSLTAADMRDFRVFALLLKGATSETNASRATLQKAGVRGRSL